MRRRTVEGVFGGREARSRSGVGMYGSAREDSEDARVVTVASRGVEGTTEPFEKRTSKKWTLGGLDVEYPTFCDLSGREGCADRKCWAGVGVSKKERASERAAAKRSD